MASKTKKVRIADPAQAGTVIQQREGLPHSVREQEIRNRAYELYLLRGAEPGHELEDWLQAERELSAKLPSSVAQRSSK